MKTESETTSAAHILCIEDSKLFQKTLKLEFTDLIESGQIRLYFASSIDEGLKVLSDKLIHVVLLDINLNSENNENAGPTLPATEIEPKNNGIHAIQEIKNLQSHIEVIMVTGYSKEEVGEFSTRRGAISVVEKKDIRELRTHLQWAVKLARQSLAQLAAAFGGPDEIPYIVGTSHQAKLERARISAAVKIPNENILILGEPGSGKTSRAKWIHTLRGIRMGKPNRPFVNFNVSNWTDTMIDRELFGHKRGSFTGAESDMKGVVQRAEGGTLFLDEFGELKPDLQSKFLKLLQERVYTPLGGTEQQAKCDIIAATNRDLTQAVAKKEFRQDLYERFAIVIRIAPLYERVEDLPYIVRSVLRGLRHRFKESMLDLSNVPPNLMTVIQESPLRGGYRVIENIFKALILFAPEDPFTGLRDYESWQEIPEVLDILENSRLTQPPLQPEPLPSCDAPLSQLPLTWAELRDRTLNIVGDPEFPGLISAIELLRAKIYQDACKKYGTNQQVANALDVALSTVGPHVLRARTSSAPPLGLKTEFKKENSERTAL